MMILIKENITEGLSAITTFRLIPIDKDCPYIEGFYDPEQGVLCMLSKEKKQVLHMVPSLDNLGDPIVLKRARGNGKTFAEERRILEAYYEYYIKDKEEILNFIKQVCNKEIVESNKDYLYEILK